MTKKDLINQLLNELAECEERIASIRARLRDALTRKPAKKAAKRKTAKKKAPAAPRGVITVGKRPAKVRANGHAHA